MPLCAAATRATSTSTSADQRESHPLQAAVAEMPGAVLADRAALRTR